MNQYWTRRRRNGLVVGGATTYKRGMTVPAVLGGSTVERTYQQRFTAGNYSMGYGYPDKWWQWHLKKERKPYAEETRHPVIGDDKCTEHGADVKCTYKCTNLQDDQCECNSTGEMIRRSSEFDLCRTSACMSTKTVPNETEHNLQTYQTVYHTALRETVNEWHRDRLSRQLSRDGDWANGPRSWPNDS